MSSLRSLVFLAAAAALGAARPASHFKSPAWLSVESPVNPYDPATRGAALLVHTRLIDRDARLGDLSGSAEGLVNGARRSIALRFDSIARPNTFGVRRQWPAEGTWLLRITLRETTALVSLDAAGNVAGTHVPTRETRDIPLPRAVGAHEIDSALAVAPKR
jgi:hypothetical protein